MRLFRRRRGRHALGAAVTAIPSAPLPVGPPRAQVPRAPGVVMTPVAPEVASEIAQLIASGEAWRSTTGTAAPTKPVSAASAPAPPSVEPLPTATAHITVPVQSSTTARDVLHAALSELATVPDDDAQSPVPAPRRVQLGFRDGTSTVLDPSSTQAQALEQLAQSLTRKD